MKKLLLLLFLFLPDRMAYADVLVVSVNGENQVALIEAATYKVLARLPTGVNPHDIAVFHDGRLAYIAVMGTPQEPGHSVTVLDLDRRAVKTTFELNPYRQCHDLRVSRNGARLWATCAPSKAVIEIDTRSGKIIRDWKLDQDGAWMLVVTPDERKIYTANLEGKSVSVIDRHANTVRALPFDSSQIGIDVSPNGREVWVHHTEKREVSVIDVATDKVVATLPSGGQGFGRVKFTPDGKYVLVPQSESRNVALFDTASRKLLSSIPLSAAPKVITVAPDSQRAIITSPDADLAMVVDLVARKESRTFPTGKTPDGIAWAVMQPTNSRSQRAFAISEKDLIPEGIAYDPVTKSFFVGSTYKRKIVRVNAHGVSRDFTAEAQDGLTGLVGMRVDAQRRWLWAISSDAGDGMPMKNQNSAERGRSHVFKYDLTTGRLLKQYTLDSQTQQHFLNDLTINAAGDVFLSNSRTQEIYSITTQKDELELFLKHEQLQNANGLDLTPDGRTLFVATRGGAAIINTATRALSFAPVPNDQPFWADGLYFYRGSLLAVGWRDGRHAVTQYFLSSDLKRIEGFRVIEAEHPAFSQPTTGVLIGNVLHYIANSHLQLFRRLFAANDQAGLAQLSGPTVLKASF